MIGLSDKDRLKIKREETALSLLKNADLDSTINISKRDVLCFFKIDPVMYNYYYNITKMRKSIPISMRKGMLLVLEQLLVIDQNLREGCDYENVYSEGKLIYKYGNRDKTIYPTLNIIHPEDAHSEYEMIHPDNYKKQIKMLNNYRLDLMQILVNQHWLISYSEVSESLYKIYDEVKQSLGK